jgi:hypothetical protein
MLQAIKECNPDDHPRKEKTLQRYGELIIRECVDACDSITSARNIEEHLELNYLGIE